MQKARRHIAAPTACKRMVSGSFSLPYSGFFSPFPHGTGSLSVSQEYLALPDGPGKFTQGYTCPALLRILLSNKLVPIQGYHLYRSTFQMILVLFTFILQSYNPNIAVTILVWALPRSLATTNGIIFIFSSYGYLDVSVLRVCPYKQVIYLQYTGLPHSEILGYVYVPLTKAYRSLSRPSSPLRAQAFPIRP